jgi:hypothetical protein
MRAVATVAAVALLAVGLLAPAAAAGDGRPDIRAVHTLAVPVAHSTAAPRAAPQSCFLGTAADLEVFSSDYEEPFDPDPVYEFPAVPPGGGSFQLIGTVYGWPGGDLVEEIALFVGRRQFFLPPVTFVGLPPGDYYLVVTYQYDTVPRDITVDWAYRVTACQPDPVGVPLGRPPRPFHFF